MSELAKIPPQAIDIEEIVLGALLIEPKSLYDVMDLLTPAKFYEPNHKTIFQAILYLEKDNKPIDLLTVTEVLRQNNSLDKIGGAYFITQLTSKINSAGHIRYHAKIIAQKWHSREMIRIANNILNKAYDLSVDPIELNEFYESESAKIALCDNNDLTDFETNLHQSIMEANDRNQRYLRNEFNGVPTGLTKLDRITGGMQPGDFILLAARPSMGKTAVALFISKNSASIGKKNLLFFSLEMSRRKLTDRILLSETSVVSDNFNCGDLTDTDFMELSGSFDKLSDLTFFIDDKSRNLTQIKSRARNFVKKNDLGLIVIDYLQLITISGNFGNKNNEVEEVSKALKNLSVELECPVLCLSQLNRAVEQRPDKMPILSDLRQSGGLEQDADMIIFLLRPDYYDKDTLNFEPTNKIFLNIAKNRQGSLQTLEYYHNKSVNNFADVPFDDLEGEPF